MRKYLIVIFIFILLGNFLVPPTLQSTPQKKSGEKQIYKESKTGKSHKTYKEKKNNIVDKDPWVYITKTGKKYHLSWCKHLKLSKIKIRLSVAKREKYTSCSRCKPPDYITYKKKKR